MDLIIREQIYKECLNRKKLFPNITVETLLGNIKIYDYINSIRLEGNYGGKLELSKAHTLYNINIGIYLEEYEENSELYNLKFCKYINEDNNENKNF